MANSVYDPEKQSDNDSPEPRTLHKNPAKPSKDASSQEDLRDAESSGGSGLFNPGDKDDKGSSLSPTALLGHESGGSTGSSGSFNFNPGKAGETGAGGFKNFFLGSTKRKRATIGGGVVGSLLLGGGIFTFFLIAGPAQLIQLSQLLQHNSSVSQSDSESRTNSLLRSYKVYKTGDYRYSRVGLMGARSMNKIVGQFEDAGVKFTGSSITGRSTAIEVDRATVENNFPETKGMSDAEFNDFLNGKFQVGSGISFETAEAGKSYKLDIRGFNAQSIRSFINSASTEILGNGKVITAIKTRNLKQFFGIDDLFHWFSQAFNDKLNSRAADIEKSNPNESEGAAKNEAASEVTDSQFSGSATPIEKPGVDEFNTFKDKENAQEAEASVGSKVTAGFATIWASACMLKGLSGAIVTMNRSLIVLPSALEAAQLVGMGSEIQNGGNDITMAQVGAVVKGFKDSQGQTIWSGAALQATEGADKANSLPKNSNGQIENDLPGDYKQAFGTDTTSSTLNSLGDIMLSWFPFHYVSGVIPYGQCGPVAGASIIVGGVIGQTILAIANAGDGEAGDVIINGGLKALASGGENIGQGYIQGKLLGPVINSVVGRIAKATVAPALTRESFSGALGGNLIAYGARAAANSAAILNGGLALGNNASTIIGSAGQQQQQQFRSESFFARTFNVNDYRSLGGHLAADISPDVGTDLQLGLNNTLNIGGILTSVFGNLLPHVAAYDGSDSWTGNYDWGFPQYGIPQNMLNDPALSDPPQNAEAVGKYLSSVCTDGNGNIGPDKGACAGSVPTDSNDPGGGYTDRIKQCFGDNLTYGEDSDVGGEVWDVTHTATAASSDVNPVSDTYQNANCGNICPDTIADCGNSSKEQWEKIVMFVNDAFNIKALDCAGGSSTTSDQSCTDVGLSQASSTGTGSPAAPPGASGYMNPLRDVKNLGTSRVDEGADFTGSGPIYALGDGMVVNTVNSGWPGGAFIVYKLSSGPANGKYVYVAENCPPQVHIGETVHSNTVLCNMIDSSPYIETGWADGSGTPGSLGDALAKPVYVELPSGSSYATAYGQNFTELLYSTGVTTQECYDFPGAKLSGSPLPSDWPTWTSSPATTSGSKGC